MSSEGEGYYGSSGDYVYGPDDFALDDVARDCDHACACEYDCERDCKCKDNPKFPLSRPRPVA